MEEHSRKNRCKSALTLQEISMRKMSVLIDTQMEACYKNKNQNLAENWLCYLQPAYHLLGEILEFIPTLKTIDYVIFYPFFRILSINSHVLCTKLLCMKEGQLNFPNVRQLNLAIGRAFEEAARVNTDRLLETVIKSVKNVESITINCDFSDQFLYDIGRYCADLKVFQSSSDLALRISNQGLVCLCKCRNLTQVMFFDCCDDYDYEDVNSDVTGKGIAELLISLPDLKVFTYKCMELQKALKHILSHEGAKKLKLEYLSLRHTDTEFINSCVSILCPNLIELTLDSVHCLQLCDSLILFPHLRRLTLMNCSVSVLTTNEKSNGVLSRLSALGIIHPTDMLDANFYETLGKCCVSLQELSIDLHDFNCGFSGTVHRTGIKIFPSIQLLHLAGSVSFTLADYLITNTCTIRRLFMASSCFEHFSDSLVAGAQSGALDRLSSLHVVNCVVSIDAIMIIIDKCCNLENIWGLELTDLTMEDIKFVETYVRYRNLNVTLHSKEIDRICSGFNASLGYKMYMQVHYS